MSLVNTAMHCAATGVVVRGFDRQLSGDEITKASVADGSKAAVARNQRMQVSVGLNDPGLR